MPNKAPPQSVISSDMFNYLPCFFALYCQSLINHDVWYFLQSVFCIRLCSNAKQWCINKSTGDWQNIRSLQGDYVRKWYSLFQLEYGSRSLEIACHDDISWDLICMLAVIDTDRQGCPLKVDIRYPVTFDGDEIVEKLKWVSGQLGARWLWTAVMLHFVSLRTILSSSFCWELIQL